MDPPLFNPFHYSPRLTGGLPTAITKPQIEALLKREVLQGSMFDEDLVEVSTEEVRYIVRRNPQRAEELAAVRQSKRERLDN